MKNRKNIINLSIFLLLFLATIYILIQNRNSTTNVKPDEFAVEDTAAISKVFIADMQGNSVILEKRDNEWLVNNLFPANKDRIALMLDLIKRVEIKNPTPLTMRDNVIRDMATSAIKVEFYTGGKKPVKTIYIGGPTQDNLGTFMALDNKEKEPYVVHIPGFAGYLSDGYFFTEENEWRSKAIFAYDPLQIKSVEVNYNLLADSSFLLTTHSENNFSLIRTSDQVEIIDFDARKVKSFLQGFSKLYFVELETDLNKFKQDSILHSKPVISITVKNLQNVSKTLDLFYRPTDLRTRVELFKGVDKEYFLGTVSDRKGDLVIVQRLSLERIMWKTEDFKTEK